MTRAFWVYDSPSPQAILSTDAANALPVEEIIKVRIDRYFYEREVARRANPDHCQSRQLDEPDSPLTPGCPRRLIPPEDRHGLSKTGQPLPMWASPHPLSALKTWTETGSPAKPREKP